MIHLAGRGEPPMTLRSAANGQALRVALVDEAGRVARPADVETVIDPGLRRSRVGD